MRIVDKNKGLYISDAYVIQLHGKVISINDIPIEFQSPKKAKETFDYLVSKLQKIEDGQDDSVVIEVTDNVVIAYGTVIELTPATVKINGIPIYTGYRNSQPLFEEIKAQLLQQKIENTLNPTVAPLILKKQGFINIVDGNSETGEGNSGGSSGAVGGSGTIQVGDWCPNKDIYLCQADGKPTIKVNPPTVGAIWIDTKDMDIYFCVDNTKDNNVWKSLKGDLIKPLDKPLVTLENITKPTPITLDEELNDGFTLVFYGEDWQSGNYHFFFQAKDANGNWLNDAYYGNGFTIRQNCGFSYQYLDTPPSGERLVAVFRMSPSGYLIRFYRVNTSVAVQTAPTKAYEKTGSIKSCSGIKQFCVYDAACDGKYTLGGEIIKFELYDTPLPDDEIDQIVNRIVNG